MCSLFQYLCCCFKQSFTTNLINYDSDNEDYVYTNIYYTNNIDYYSCNNCNRQFNSIINLKELHLIGDYCIYCKK